MEMLKLTSWGDFSSDVALYWISFLKNQNGYQSVFYVSNTEQRCDKLHLFVFIAWYMTLEIIRVCGVYFDYICI